MLRWSFVACVVIGNFAWIGAVANAEDVVFFEQHVRPLLSTKCVKCHGAIKQEGGLRLDSLEAMLQGGESGPAIVPGNRSESLISSAIHFESHEMPPTGKLADAEIASVDQWIERGAHWPKHAEPVRDTASGISDSDRQWWAFQPLAQVDVPFLANDEWSQTEIDRFIYASLAKQELNPAPLASKRQLVRRLYFDLIGVPPTPTEVDSFMTNDSDDAWEQLVDVLLNDVRYGEHWGRYWLDLVRYAESDGWNKDSYRPDIWRYRDYVVSSFNSDKPYPQFVREQLAGDENVEPSPDALVATGYLRLGIYEYNQRDARGLWNDVINEITDVTADVFIGMGMSCARCHDHKFDPIPQKDYFKLRAFFEPLIWRDDIPLADRKQASQYQLNLAVWKAMSKNVQDEIDSLCKPYRDRKWKETADKFPLDIQACFYKPVALRNSWEHQMSYLIGRQFEEEGAPALSVMTKEDAAKLDELNKKLSQYDHLKPKPLASLMTASGFPGAVSPTLIPDVAEPEPISPGFLSVFGDIPFGLESHSIESASPSGRRTALANWIGNPDNPLTTRVIVNRVWQQHFGQGIVPTSSDFGHLGLPPTHPELLDWLTKKFIEDGWSFKKLHKRILMSSAWCQSSWNPDQVACQEKDPAEALLWRFRIRRLNAEQIRDSALAISGELSEQVGGPSVDGDKSRRSLYVKFQRNTPDTLLQLFDIANGLASVSERNKTTTPIQSLMMFNGKWVLTRAERMSEQLIKRFPDQSRELLIEAFELAWGREPQESELDAAREFVGEPIRSDALVDFCHVILNSNEFLYVD